MTESTGIREFGASKDSILDKKLTVDSGPPVPLIADGGKGEEGVPTGVAIGPLANFEVLDVVADPANPTVEKLN